jgi:hypothetical protein
MWSRHQVTVAEANEALADADARLYDPDPKSKNGSSARVIGYSPTAVAVLVVILVHREDKPDAWLGANGWRPTARTDVYIEKEHWNEQRRKAAGRTDRCRS